MVGREGFEGSEHHNSNEFGRDSKANKNHTLGSHAHGNQGVTRQKEVKTRTEIAQGEQPNGPNSGLPREYKTAISVADLIRDVASCQDLPDHIRTAILALLDTVPNPEAPE